jgi:FkbM family methyltransferase
MILFDIGANRGDAVIAGINRGFTKIIALEPAPRVYRDLVSNFIYSSEVIPLRLAVSDTNNQTVEFYEAEEDGLSTLNKEWLTSDSLPYAGKPFRNIKVNTITIDDLVIKYGNPDLIKIDVEGAEWSVFKGMTKYQGMLTFEWTDATIEEHQKQLNYLSDLGYKQIAPQFITNHLEEPPTWYPIDIDFKQWVSNNSKEWEEIKWKEAGLRPTADVGMCWVK